MNPCFSSCASDTVEMFYYNSILDLHNLTSIAHLSNITTKFSVMIDFKKLSASFALVYILRPSSGYNPAAG
jgi:hypothetical protein